MEEINAQLSAVEDQFRDMSIAAHAMEDNQRHVTEELVP
jgi:hypothetical protein